jgi:hypothetical protein
LGFRLHILFRAYVQRDDEFGCGCFCVIQLRSGSGKGQLFGFAQEFS